MLQWIVAESEQSKEDGVRFMCRHAEDLGLPYKWNTIMSFLHISMNHNGFMIALDGSGKVRGVLAYTYVTGGDGSVDLTRIEVILLYLEAGFRRGKVLLEAMEALVEREQELHEPVGEIGFYCTPTEGYRRLFGKFSTFKNTEMHPCGMLSIYVTTPGRLSEYVGRHTSRKVR